jgi:hypothetical protein
LRGLSMSAGLNDTFGITHMLAAKQHRSSWPVLLPRSTSTCAFNQAALPMACTVSNADTGENRVTFA